MTIKRLRGIAEKGMSRRHLPAMANKLLNHGFIFLKCPTLHHDVSSVVIRYNYTITSNNNMNIVPKDSSAANWQGPLILTGFLLSFAVVTGVIYFIIKRCNQPSEEPRPRHCEPCKRFCMPCTNRLSDCTSRLCTPPKNMLSGCCSDCGSICGECFDQGLKCIECGCKNLCEKCCEPICGDCCSKLCDDMAKFEVEPEKWPKCSTCCHPPYKCCSTKQERQEAAEAETKRMTHIASSEEVPKSQTRVTFGEAPTIILPCRVKTPTSSSKVTHHVTSESNKQVITAQIAPAQKTKEGSPINIDNTAFYTKTDVSSRNRNFGDKCEYLLGVRDLDLFSRPSTSSGAPASQQR